MTTAALQPLHDTGQVLRHSHPHLVNDTDLVPGFSAKELAARRLGVLASLLSPCSSDGTALNRVAVLVPSQPEAVQTNDVHFPFRQSSDVLYLSGFGEPDALVVLQAARSPPSGSTSSTVPPFTLLCRERNPLREQWDGARAGTDGAKRIFGADHVVSSSDVTERHSCLKQVFAQNDRVFFDDTINAEWTARVKQAAVETGKSYEAPGTVLARPRAIKSDAELQAMRTAARFLFISHVFKSL